MLEQMIIKILSITKWCKCSQRYIQIVFTPGSLHSSSQMTDNNLEDILMDPLTLMGRMPVKLIETCKINFSAQMLSQIICFFFPFQIPPPHPQIGDVSKRFCRKIPCYRKEVNKKWHIFWIIFLLLRLIAGYGSLIQLGHITYLL